MGARIAVLTCVFGLAVVVSMGLASASSHRNYAGTVRASGHPSAELSTLATKSGGRYRVISFETGKLPLSCKGASEARRGVRLRVPSSEKLFTDEDGSFRLRVQFASVETQEISYQAAVTGTVLRRSASGTVKVETFRKAQGACTSGLLRWRAA